MHQSIVEARCKHYCKNVESPYSLVCNPAVAGASRMIWIQLEISYAENVLDIECELESCNQITLFGTLLMKPPSTSLQACD
jgi:hypothetical protein